MTSQIQTIKNWLGTGSINFFGPPFSGKDTQANKLAKLFGGRVVAGGDILRHNHGNTAVQQIMAAGGIVPSDLFLSIIPPFFAHPDLAGIPLFLSSVGRLTSEVPTIVGATNESHHPLKAVILLQLPEAGVWQHFDISQALHDRGTRADDNRAALQVRLEEFAKTAPVIDYYRAQGLLIEIDDTKTPDEVSQAILDALETQAKAA